MPVPYYLTVANFETNESPIRTSFPVGTIPGRPLNPPPTRDPPEIPQKPSGNAGGTNHDPLCMTDLRKRLDVYIKR